MQNLHGKDKNWFISLFCRRLLVAVLILVQAWFILNLILNGSRISTAINTVLRILSLLVAINIVSSKKKGSFKTTWVILILLFPIFGGLLYLLIFSQSPTKKTAAAYRDIVKISLPLFELPGTGFNEAREATGDIFQQVKYLQDYAGFPVYQNTKCDYFASGEALAAAMKRELEEARKYIFMEYFIVKSGVLWDGIVDILKRKAAEGVKVRIIYDDLGCFLLLPSDYTKELKGYGIECTVFNPFHPFLTVTQNNRDHRKMCIIDGKKAFTGGINMSDEYINAVERFGHWKDGGVLVSGKAAWGFAVMFLQMWAHCRKTDVDYGEFYPWKTEECGEESDGFVIPYTDSPLDSENVGEHVYLQIINQAKDYVYITTPYLVVDDSMVSALSLAAKRGVDVRIITPHKWDKFFVHLTTRSYYRDLISAGVRIYEYSSGFIHAKNFVSDDRVSTVGTANMDYRSLYLHFECGAWMYGCRAVTDVKQDFLDTLRDCQPITEDDCRENIAMRLLQDVLRVFAPLM